VTLVDSLQPQEPIAIAVPIAAIGRLLTLAGTALAIGVVTFSMATQARRQSEIRIVNTLTRLGALAVMIGSLAVFGGHVAITANGWDSVTIGTVQEELSSGLGFAVIMRLMAATLFLWWTLTQSRSIVLTAPISAPVPALVASGARSAGQTHRSAGPPDRAGNQHNNTHIDHTYEGHLRWGGTLTTGTAFLLASFTLDGHTFTEGNHLLTSAATVAHVAAGSVWAGGVVALAAILLSRRRQGNPLDAVDLVVRFSTLAGPALAAAGAAGVALTVIILNELSQLWTTPWGQILLVKTIAVGMAAMIGAYNHLVLVPALDQRGGADRSRSDSAAARVRSTITAEALLMIPIITLTAFLVVASSRV
jgi:copper transport protein